MTDVCALPGINRMAIFHSHAAVVKRSAGHSSIAAACYRTGERIVDERTGEIHDYGKRSGVVISKIFAPTDAPEWTSDRSRLWNMVEKVEARKDAQLCRTWDIALPVELSADQRLALVKKYCLDELVSRGMVVDMSIHAPHRGKETRNHHVHIAATMRDVGPEGFKQKNRTWNRAELIVELRECWANHVNAALLQAGHTTRIDHRTLEDQGVKRLPGRHLGKRASALENRGISTNNGSYNRQVVDLAKLHEECSRLDNELGSVLSEISYTRSILEIEKNADSKAVPLPQSTLSELKSQKNALLGAEQKLHQEKRAVEQERWRERRRRRGLLAWLVGLRRDHMYKKYIRQLQERKDNLRLERERVAAELKTRNQEAQEKGLRDIQTTEKTKFPAVTLQLKPQQAVEGERIIGTVTEIVCCYREYAQKIFEIDPAKARTLRAICNAELKTLPNKGTIELPAPSNDLKEIRAVLKQHKATRGYGR